MTVDSAIPPAVAAAVIAEVGASTAGPSTCPNPPIRQPDELRDRRRRIETVLDQPAPRG
jgi:hypothetical protein